MANKILFEGTHNSTPASDRRIPIGYENIEGSEYIEFGELIETERNFVNLTPQSTYPSYLEGRLFYDDVKHTLAIYNEQSNVLLNIGEEIFAPIVRNVSGDTILNGTVVYISGIDSGYYKIDKADASEKEKCRLVFVATQDIANNTNGRITRYGEVGDLNTNSFLAGDTVYLSDSTPGEITTSTPLDGSYIVVVGTIKNKSTSSGILLVNPVSDFRTVEVTDTNGFPVDQLTNISLSFDDATRVFTIAPVSGNYHFYQYGKKYSISTSKTATLTNVTGGHVIYYDAGLLSVMANPTAAQIAYIILTKCIVAYIYYNTTLVRAVRKYDERHGIGMSPVDHLYNHKHNGARYTSGFAPDSIVIGDGSSNSHAQFGVLTGEFDDEDLTHVLSTVASTTGLTYLYKTGASGNWNDGTNSGYSFPVGATPLPQYNQYTGGAWQLTECPTGYFMNLHIFADPDWNLKPVSILGTSAYTNANLATAGQEVELNSILGGLPGPEYVLLFSVILEAKTSFTNSVNCRVVANSQGANYTDWRFTKLTASATPANHDNLLGLQAAGTGVTWGHINETLYKLIYPNQVSVTSSATPTPTGDYKQNEYFLTALSAGATFAAPSGTPVNGNTLLIRIKDNGTARELAWNSIYRAVGITLPTTTVISKTLYVGAIYNSSDSKWDVVSVVKE